MKLKGLNWKRILGEAVLIVASVYVAIVLEGISDERSRTSDALDALTQLLGELRQDRADLDEVLAEQDDLDRRYADLLRWFASPRSLPADSVQETLDLVAYSNRTMFPRRGAWTTMVASAQLGLLDDPELVTRLGDVYENVFVRLSYNGEVYDGVLFEVMLHTTPTIWDPHGRRLLTTDSAALAKFRGQLRGLHVNFNGWYRWYLRRYGEQLDRLIAEVEEYLRARGRRV